MPGTLEARMLQMAYRAAVNQSPDRNPPPLENIPARVEERFETFREGAMSVTSIIAHNQTAAAIVAGGVVLGLASAVNVVSKGWKTVGEKHAKLEEEIIEQVSMFGVRETGVTPRPTFEQKLIRAYYLELEKELWLMRYSGIRRIEAPEPGAKTMYFVLPFYTMDTKVLKPLASMNAVDRVRTLIDTFLRVTLPEALADIERAFESYKQYTLLSAGKYVVQKGNFLNNWRSARFIMITLGNLLWNLQHPGDLRTGHHLSVDECVKYCHRVLILINSLLNPQEAPFLVHRDMFGHVHQESEQLLKYITSVQLLVRNLHQAYRYDQMNTINLADLTNTSHRVLGTLNTALFKLLYQRESKEAKIPVPDDRAADLLSSHFNELTLVLQGNNAIVDVFQPYIKKFRDIPFLNYNITTLIDILIIFTHLPYADRAALVTALQERTVLYGEPSWSKFAEGLASLEKRFIQPIAMQDQSNRFFQSAHAARITGRRLIPFFTLLMAALRTDVDTGNSYQLALNEQSMSRSSNPEAMYYSPQSQYAHAYDDSDGSIDSYVTSRSTLNMEVHLNPNLKMQRSGRQQIEAINFQARQANSLDYVYFSWQVKLFTRHMPLSSQAFMRQIYKLPLEEDQLIQLVKILDAIAAVRDLDPIFLQEKAFKLFFLRYLNKIKKEFRTFNQKLARAGDTISSHEGISPQIQSIFSNMMEEMEGSLEAVDTAANTLTSIVDNPNFMNEEKHSLASLIRYIEHSYTQLFPQDKSPGITALLSINDEAIGGHKRHYETRETQFTEEMAKKSRARRMMSVLMHTIKPKYYDAEVQTTDDNPSFVALPPPNALDHDEHKDDEPHLYQSPNRTMMFYDRSNASQNNNEAQTVALKMWMEQCLEHMSSLSRYEYSSSYIPYLSFGGEKGRLLNKLIEDVSYKSVLNDDELDFYFLNLVRIVGSYRVTPLGFFQAAWGETRAMEPILKAIKNPNYNQMFPFKRILFQNKNLDLDCLTQDELLDELIDVSDEYNWELSVHEIEASSLDYEAS
ncbi:MAG: hypothetical protein P1U39_06145 [Legionellaceae bacterium]|nr:hypothetical protein [Legionellaceae bacterium]